MKSVPTGNFQVGLIHIFVDMVRAPRHTNKAGHLAEQLPLSVALHGDPAICQNALGSFGDDGKHSDGFAEFIDYRRVVEICPKLPGNSVTVQPELAVLVGKCSPAVKHLLEDMGIEVGDLRPRFQHVASQ